MKFAGFSGIAVVELPKLGRAVEELRWSDVGQVSGMGAWFGAQLRAVKD